MILVDTSVWIDFFNGKDTTAVATFEALVRSKKALCINGIIEMEILQGIREDKKHRLTQECLRPFLRFSDCKYAYLIKAAEIYRQCRAKSVTVRKSVDCIIAACAIVEDLAVLHQDRDFSQIKKAVPDLVLYN